MTTAHYATAWATYLVGALGCLTVWWRITRPFGQGFPRRCLRSMATFIILTPTISTPGMVYLGPALLVCIFDALSSGVEEAMLRTAPTLLVSLLAATLLAALGGLFIKTPTDGLSTKQPMNANRPRKEPFL